MKSYSDELPNIDKDKLDQVAGQLVDVNLIVNSISYEVSRLQDWVVILIGLTGVNLLVAAFTLYTIHHH